MDDPTEKNAGKEVTPEPDPEPEVKKSSKFKLKRSSLQRSNLFQRTVKRKSQKEGSTQQDSDDGDDEGPEEAEGQGRGQSQNQPTETDKDFKEIEDIGEKLSETCVGDVGDDVNDDYDDYSSHIERDVCKDPSHSASLEPEVGLVGNLTDIGASVGGFLGRFTTQAWSYARTTWQSYQDYLLASDSEDDDWGESRTDQDSDDDDDFNFEDAAEELEPRDRLHHICHELMQTEEQYVRRLKLLVSVKEETTKILKADVAKAMFQDVEVIHQFHQDNLLPQLQERLKFWEKYRRIGDIMKKFSPFLKLYTEYVKNFRKATAMVDTYEEKSSSFASLLKDIRDRKEGGKLKVQAHMMEPVQRVPRYALLLNDYMKRLPEDSPDRPDTEKALELVTAAATHFESMIKRDSRLAQLMQIQSQLDGSVSVVSCKRELIKQGKVNIVNPRTAKLSERYVFLFNDMLLVCNEQSILGSKYKVKNNIDLEEAQIAEGNNLDLPNTFYVKSTNNVVEFHSSTDLETEVWQNAILRQIGECTKTKLLKKGSRRVRESQLTPQTLGKRAPVLVRHNEVTMCMICATEFSALRRKRHCRACGVVICGKCSSHTARMEYDKGKTARVCDECFVIMQDMDGAAATKSQTSRDPKGHTRKPTEGECIHKGCLHLSSDGGKTWKKRWFAAHDSTNLYSFKAPQDISPLTSLALKGFRYQLTHNEQKKSLVLELSGPAKKYYLFDETDGLQEWINVLSKLVPHVTSKTDVENVDKTSGT